MFISRFRVAALGVVAALVVAGVAIAASKPVSATATSVSAAFTATTVSHAHNTTCTNKGGDAFQETDATYKGTSTSQDPRFNGPITIKAHSFLDTTSSVGVLNGTFTIVGSKKNAVTGKISGVLSADGAFSGLASGTAKGPNGALLASLGGSFSQSGGFTAASLGGPETGGGAVISDGYCAKPKK